MLSDAVLNSLLLLRAVIFFVYFEDGRVAIYLHQFLVVQKLLLSPLFQLHLFAQLALHAVAKGRLAYLVCLIFFKHGVFRDHFWHLVLHNI